MEEEKRMITIEDIENERVEFEKGVWVFLADNLRQLHRKFAKALKGNPDYAKRKSNLKNLRVRPTISKYE